MRHVIAGQPQEDTIEWRLSMDSGEPTLQARPLGRGDWKCIAWPSMCPGKFIVYEPGLLELGFTEVSVVDH